MRYLQIFVQCVHHKNVELFHDGGPYYIENSQLICSVDQWTGYYMIGTTVIKELRGIISFCLIKNFTFSLTFCILAAEPNFLNLYSDLPNKNCFSFNESPLKMLKNAFYFIFKGLFVLKIINVLSWLFGHVEKVTWLER